MANKNIKKGPVIFLTSWEEVDQKLRRMGEIQIALEKIEGDMTLRINEVKENYEPEADALKIERQNLEEAISSFSELHKDEFMKIRSKNLTFGYVAYRIIRKIVIHSNDACIAALRALHLDQYIRTVYEPNKEAMVDLDDKQLAKVGAKRKIEDKFRSEPDIERIKKAA